VGTAILHGNRGEAGEKRRRGVVYLSRSTAPDQGSRKTINDES